MMKHRLAFLVLCVAALLAAMSLAALAETFDDPLKVEMQLQTNEFSAPRQITITIQVRNTGESDMPGPVSLYYPNEKKVEEFGDPVLAVGNVKSWTGKWTVTQKQLTEGKITFSIKYYMYDDNGELRAKQKYFSKRITYKGAITSVEVNRTIAPTTANKDQEVSVTYDVINTGTVDISDVKITENKSISSTVGTIASIKAGEKGSYTFKVKMGTKDLTSKATITYMAAGSKHTENKEATTIKYGEVKLTASLSADKKGGLAGENVKLTLKLTNSGKVDYQNVNVSDPALGVLVSNGTVEAGKTLTLERDLVVAETADYQFSITASTEGGAAVDMMTDRVTITAIQPSQVLKLGVEATADREVVYELPGTVRFTVAVTNQSTADVENVSVSASGVTLYNFDKIAAGDTRRFTRDVDVSMAGQFQFVARARNQLNETQSFESNLLRVSYMQPTPVPTEAPIVTPPAPVYKQLPTEADLSTDYTGISRVMRIGSTVLAIPALIGLVLVLIVGIRRGANAAESAKAYDHLERGYVRDYTARSKDPNVVGSDAEEADRDGESSLSSDDESVKA